MRTCYCRAHENAVVLALDYASGTLYELQSCITHKVFLTVVPFFYSYRIVIIMLELVSLTTSVLISYLYVRVVCYDIFTAVSC